jgi:hypothetical protein
MPPGLSSDLMTFVATIMVPQVGQLFPLTCAFLSVRLARAVLLNFSANECSLRIEELLLNAGIKDTRKWEYQSSFRCYDEKETTAKTHRLIPLWW